MTGVRFGVLFLALFALSAPSAALAEEPGVNVDPRSPAGKEYAIPLEEARRQAAPDESSSGIASESGSSGSASEGDSPGGESDGGGSATQEGK